MSLPRSERIFYSLHSPKNSPCPTPTSSLPTLKTGSVNSLAAPPLNPSEIYNKLLTKAALFFCLLFACIGSGYAAYPGITYIGIENGLSSNDVTCIYQDHKGFMWFGTFEGLNQYDGSHFTIFKKAPLDSNSLSDSRIYAITEDKSNRLWIGTRVGASIYNPLHSTFMQVKYQLPGQKEVSTIQSAVKSLYVLGQQKMLLAAEKEGLLLYNQPEKLARPVALTTKTGLVTSYNAISIEADSKGRIWVLVRDIGICLYDPAKGTLRLQNDFLKSGNYLKADREGNLWIGTDAGLYQYQPATGSLSAVLSGNKVLFLNIDHQNQLWIATDGGGLFLMPLSTKKPFIFNPGDPKLSLSSNAICSIYFDKENRDWIGTIRGGINIFDQKQTLFRTFKHISFKPGALSNDFVLCFLAAENNGIWIGTDGGGLNYWDRTAGVFKQYSRPQQKDSLSKGLAITSLLIGDGQQVLASTWGEGILVADKARGYFDRLRCFNTVTHKEDRFVWKLYRDKTGVIWASTCNDGSLYRYNAATRQFELFDHRLTNIISFGEDRQGNLWVGDFSHLIKIDRRHKTNTRFKIDYPVRSIFQDSEGNFWIGTEGGGLLLFNESKGQIQRYTEKQGLPSNSILSIMEDEDKNIWLSSYHGLCRFSVITHKIKNYTQADGLQSNQFSYNAALKLPSGEMLFGGIRGFNVFLPTDVNSTNPDLNTKEVYITSLKINNIALNGDNDFVSGTRDGAVTALTLPYGTATLSINFVSPEFSSPEKIQYAYYLEGIDKKWNYVGNARTANYARLPAGQYIFHVKASNRDELWGGPDQQIRLTILPPWYESWWAWILYIALVVTGIIIFNRFRARQRLAEYKVKLAHLEKEKEKEIHEKRLTFFTQISHELRTPLTLIINPLKEVLDHPVTDQAAPELQIAYRNARRLLALVDQLLLFRKTESEQDQLMLTRLDMNLLTEEVYQFFIHQAKSKTLNYQFSTSAGHCLIEADKEKLEISLFNIISNAIKYTPAGGQVTVLMEEDAKYLYIHVRDSGQGIGPEVGDQLFDNFYQVKPAGKQEFTGFGIGLFLTRKFIEQHGGQIYYQSKPGAGTTFTIRLKAGQSSSHALRATGQEQRPEARPSQLLRELNTGQEAESPQQLQAAHAAIGTHLKAEELISDKRTLLIVEDNEEIRRYIKGIFLPQMQVYEAGDGILGLQMAHSYTPDIIISDINMEGLTGIELCQKIKEDPAIRHIPVILLTAVMSQEIKLKGIQSGADDYIIKPFDKELLVARVTNLLTSRNNLQQYYLDTITLKTNPVKVPAGYQDFLNECIQVVENNLDEEGFNVKTMAKKMGMSHSSLYTRIKAISGQSVNAFIRSIRLRRAAVLLLSTELNINEVAFEIGLADLKYFRAQFHKLYGMNPSEYKKRYRIFFNRELSVIKMEDPGASKTDPLS